MKWLLVLCRRLSIPIRSSEGDTVSVQKALTAGLFMNAVQLSETTADLQNPSNSGINVYRMLRSSGPGEAWDGQTYKNHLLGVQAPCALPDMPELFLQHSKLPPVPEVLILGMCEEQLGASPEGRQWCV